DVLRIATGDRAEARILDRPVAGKVLRIARSVGRNTLRSQDPRALQDLRVVRVTIALDDPAYAAQFMNMQIDVTIRPTRVARKQAAGPGNWRSTPACRRARSPADWPRPRRPGRSGTCCMRGDVRWWPSPASASHR